MANRIFLAYANSKQQPLPSLREEDDKLFEILSQREVREHFKLHRDAYITTRKLGRYLNQYKNEIMVFHYSGHADRDQLFLEDKPALADGIAQYLSQCPNLKLIVLNGCSTVGQVRRLLDLETKPVVIATHAPVGDQSATLFSITFYEQLCHQEKTIEQAFKTALDQVQLSEGEIQVFKGLMPRQSRKSEDKKAVWGMFPENGTRLHWKIPTEQMDLTASDFIPNSILIEQLLAAYAPFDERAKDLLKQGESATEAEKIKAILEPLPLPVSEHLRKLMTPEQIWSAHNFFDRINAGRLNQIGITYGTIMELVAFILLAELWDLGINNKSIAIEEQDFKTLKHFFKLSYDDRQHYDFPDLIHELQKIIKKNKAAIYVEELLQLLDPTDSSNEFGEAVAYLETIKSTEVASLEKSEIHQKCVKGEEMLAVIFRHLAFFTLYSISSVKSIDVHHYRHSLQPKFSHRVVRLIQTFVNKLQEDRAESLEYMYTASVILTRKGKKDFLNLSPFIIDQNAFEEKTELAKLHYFEVYEKETDSFAFKHIYKPEEFSLETANNEKVYDVIKEQFNAFTQLLFKKPIHSL